MGGVSPSDVIRALPEIGSAMESRIEVASLFISLARYTLKASSFLITNAYPGVFLSGFFSDYVPRHGPPCHT